MKSTPNIQEIPLRFVEIVSKIIAFFVCVGLMMAAGIITYQAYFAMFNQNLDQAVQDGLFVLILLEMFYVTRSFIRYGTINVSIVISVGLIAAVKEMIFQLQSMTMQLAIGFGVIFITLGLTYYFEKTYYKYIITTGLKKV